MNGISERMNRDCRGGQAGKAQGTPVPTANENPGQVTGADSWASVRRRHRHRACAPTTQPQRVIAFSPGRGWQRQEHLANETGPPEEHGAAPPTSQSVACFTPQPGIRIRMQAMLK